MGTAPLIAFTIIPTVIFFIIWTFFPMVYSFVMSFTKWNPLSAKNPFLGLSNYVEVVTDVIFWTAVRNTLYYTAMYLPSVIVISLVLALAINSVKQGASFFRTVYFFPVITSGVASMVIWKWLYQPRFGLFNAVLEFLADNLGLPVPYDLRYVMDVNMAMPSIVFMDLWKSAGFPMVIYLASLQNIPKQVYEAARIDGASSWQTFWYITFPMIKPTTMFVSVMTMIGSLQIFVQAFIMTRGGPMRATTTIVYLLWEAAFTLHRFGYAAAMAFLLLIGVLALTLLQMRLLRTKWEY